MPRVQDAMVANGEFESMGCQVPITVRRASSPAGHPHSTWLNVDLAPRVFQGSHEPAGTIVAMGDEAKKLAKHKVGLSAELTYDAS